MRNEYRIPCIPLWTLETPGFVLDLLVRWLDAMITPSTASKAPKNLVPGLLGTPPWCTETSQRCEALLGVKQMLFTSLSSLKVSSGRKSHDFGFPTFIQSPFLGILMSLVPIWAVSSSTHICAAQRHVSKPVTEPENPLTPDDLQAALLPWSTFEYQKG